MRAAAFTGVVALLVLVGCKSAADEDDGPSVVPKAVAFEGKLDDRFAGNWKSVDGKASMRLDKDGKLAIDQAIAAANGKSTSHVEGLWLASGDSLLFKYPEKSGGDTTLKYDAKLTAGKLALKHGSTTTLYSHQ